MICYSTFCDDQFYLSYLYFDLHHQWGLWGQQLNKRRLFFHLRITIHVSSWINTRIFLHDVVFLQSLYLDRFHPNFQCVKWTKNRITTFSFSSGSVKISIFSLASLSLQSFSASLPHSVSFASAIQITWLVDTCSSIVIGGTRPFFYMMEQFVSMGVRDHFPILWLRWPFLLRGYQCIFFT